MSRTRAGYCKGDLRLTYYPRMKAGTMDQQWHKSIVHMKANGSNIKSNGQ